MTNSELVKSYLFKAEKRLKAIEILYMERDYSDVVRESQKIVERRWLNSVPQDCVAIFFCGILFLKNTNTQKI